MFSRRRKSNLTVSTLLSLIVDNNLFATRLAYKAKKALLNADSKFFRSEQYIQCRGFML